MTNTSLKSNLKSRSLRAYSPKTPDFLYITTPIDYLLTSGYYSSESGSSNPLDPENNTL